MPISATDLFENHIFVVIYDAITAIQKDVAADVYAMTLWMYADEDDPRLQVVVFSYNTYAQATRSEDEASDANEAKWNFAFWSQDEVARVGGEEDAEAAILRASWLDERGLNYTDEEEESDFERCMELAVEIETEFWQMCARVGKRLHDSGAVSFTFGGPIPILLHNLEYYDKVVEVTLDANPDGVADEFVEWVNKM